MRAKQDYDWGGDEESYALYLPSDYKPLKQKQVFSVYPNLTKTKAEDVILSLDLNSILDLFKGESFYLYERDPKTTFIPENIKKLKNFDKKTQKKEYDQFKRFHSPVVNFNYTGKVNAGLSSVNIDNLSEYFYFDIDDAELSKEEAVQLKNSIYNTGKIAAVWLSASGYGVGGLIKISWLKDVLDFNNVNQDYKLIFDYVWKEAGLNSFNYDKQAVTLERRTVISYDKNLLKVTGLGYDPEPVKKPSQDVLDALRNSVKVNVQVKQNNAVKAKINGFNGVIQPLTEDVKQLMRLVYLEVEKSTELSTKEKNRLAEKPRDKYETKGERFINSVKTQGYNSAPLILAEYALYYGFSLQDVFNFLTQDKEFLKGERAWLVDPNSLYKQLAKISEYEGLAINAGKAFAEYCSYNAGEEDVLKDGEYFSSIVNYSKYNEEKFRIYVNASTGSGKTYGSLKYIADARKSGEKLKGILAAPLLNIGLNIEKDAQKLGLSFVRFDSTSSTEWSVELANADIIFTTFASFAKLNEKLFYNRTETITDYILFIDEIHTINEDGWKDKQSFENLLKLKDDFARVMYLTGTPQNTSFDLGVTETINCRKPLNIKKTFSFVKIEDDVKKEAELILGYIKQGYLPVVYKNNTNPTGWLGSMEIILAENGVKALLTNAKEKGEEEYDLLITSQQFNMNDYQAVISTSVIREGVSIYTSEPTKVVYIFLSTTGAPTVEQFSNRIRNAEEIKTVFVYEKDYDTTKYIKETPRTFINYKNFEYGQSEKAKAEYNSENASKLRWWSEKGVNSNLIEEYRRSFSLINEKGQICQIGLTQSIRRSINDLEAKSPFHCFWALKPYGFTFENDNTETIEVSTETLKSTLKVIRKDEKALYQEAAKLFIEVIKDNTLMRSTSSELKLDLYHTFKNNKEENKYVQLVFSTLIESTQYLQFDVNGTDNTSTFIDLLSKLGRTTKSHNKFVEKYRTFQTLYKIQNNIDGVLPLEVKLLSFVHNYIEQLNKNKSSVLGKKDLIELLVVAYKATLPKVEVIDAGNPKAKIEEAKRLKEDSVLAEKITGYLEAFIFTETSTKVDGKKEVCYKVALSGEYAQYKEGYITLAEVQEEVNRSEWRSILKEEEWNVF